MTLNPVLMLVCWHQAIDCCSSLGHILVGCIILQKCETVHLNDSAESGHWAIKWSHLSSLTIEWAQTREYAASQNRLCGQPNSDKTKHLLFDLSILRLGGKELVTEMMTTLSQTVSVFSNKAINLKSVASFNTIKTLRFNPPSSPRSLSRLVFKRLSLINFFELNLWVNLFSVTLFQEFLSSSSHNFARWRGESGGRGVISTQEFSKWWWATRDWVS